MSGFGGGDPFAGKASVNSFGELVFNSTGGRNSVGRIQIDGVAAYFPLEMSFAIGRAFFLDSGFGNGFTVENSLIDFIFRMGGNGKAWRFTSDNSNPAERCFSIESNRANQTAPVATIRGGPTPAAGGYLHVWETNDGVRHFAVSREGWPEFRTADTQTTVGAAGVASALPVLPEGYVKIKVEGVDMVSPFYKAS